MFDQTETPENSEQSLPFFARFLEGQEKQDTFFQTLKYPSDRDEIEGLEYMSGNNE